jgi:hypothetical protein
MKALNLEVFEVTQQQADAPILMLEAIAFEEAKLGAYDQGYQAGWDDAVQAQSTDQAQIGAELARNLKNLHLTMNDARSHVLTQMEPLLADIVARLLPEVARAALVPTILDSLRPLADRASDSPIEIIINPAAETAMVAVLAQSNSPAVRLTLEHNLGEGQAFIRLGQTETHIDLEGAVSQIALAVQGFFQLPERTQP